MENASELNAPTRRLILLTVPAILAHYITHFVLCLLGQPLTVFADIIGPLVMVGVFLPANALSVYFGRPWMWYAIMLCLCVGFITAIYFPFGQWSITRTRQVLAYILWPTINFVAFNILNASLKNPTSPGLIRAKG